MNIPNTILIIALSISLYTDLKQRKIFNSVTVSAAAAGLLYNAAAFGFAGVKLTLCGLVVGMSLLLIPFLMGGIGAGDVKLLGVVGAVKGTVFVINAGLYSAVAGGIFALALLAYRGILVDVFKNTAWGLATLKGSFLSEGALTGGSFPYGVAIFAGTAFVLLSGWSVWLP